MPTDEDREELRARRREIANRQAGRGGGGSAIDAAQRALEQAQQEAATATPQYNYLDPGRYGDRNYSYQVGDEFRNPGPEPPRDSPEWNEWKRHAAAWRNFIGGRQQYVNQMIGVGYDPADLGITPRKEEGRAGYNRLMQPGVIDQLRQQAAAWMRDSSDAEVDPTTGLYTTGQSGSNTYYDTHGMRVDAQGRPIGGFYGQSNTQGQFGASAVPRMPAGNYNTPPRMPRPPSTLTPTNPTVAQPVPTPPPSTLSSNYQGYGQSYGAGSIPPAYRNRQPRKRYVSPTYAQSPFGI